MVVAGVPTYARLFSFSQFKGKGAEGRMQLLDHDQDSIKHTPAQKAFGELEKVRFQPLPKTRGWSWKYSWLLGILITLCHHWIFLLTFLEAMQSFCLVFVLTFFNKAIYSR